MKQEQPDRPPSKWTQPPSQGQHVHITICIYSPVWTQIDHFLRYFVIMLAIFSLAFELLEDRNEWNVINLHLVSLAHSKHWRKTGEGEGRREQRTQIKALHLLITALVCVHRCEVHSTVSFIAYSSFWKMKWLLGFYNNLSVDMFSQSQISSRCLPHWNSPWAKILILCRFGNLYVKNIICYFESENL